jgi:hypothetical protein
LITNVQYGDRPNNSLNNLVTRLLRTPATGLMEQLGSELNTKLGLTKRSVCLHLRLTNSPADEKLHPPSDKGVDFAISINSDLKVMVFFALTIPSGPGEIAP